MTASTTKGALSGALEQTATALQHSGFVNEAITAANLEGARNHAEHIVNILDGQGGMFFGDLNRDGQAQNPGDGYGVRAYLKDAKAGAQQLLDDPAISDDARTSLLQAVTALDDAQALVTEAREQATKLYAIDTADEAVSVHDELIAALDELTQSAAASGDVFLDLAVFPLVLDPANLKAPVVLERMGQVKIAGALQDDGRMQTSGYVLTLEGMPEAPAGNHYELWAVPEGADPVRLDALALEDGALVLEGALPEGALDGDALTGAAIAISIEPDDDPEPDAPAQIAITSELAAEYAPLLRLLFVDDGINEKGALSGALEQTATALQHSGFVNEAITAANLEGARNHAEHIVNILDGQGGMFFGDLNRDGQAQNPGDGYGVRAYLKDAKAGAQQLLDDPAISDDARTSLLQAVTALDDAQALVTEAREQATKLYAIDTADEAVSVHDELIAALDELTQSAAASGDVFLDLAVFPLMLDRAFAAGGDRRRPVLGLRSPRQQRAILRQPAR